jgi:hypothetical protein
VSSGNSWATLRTTRDPDDLQGLSNDYARELGISPDMFPRVLVDAPTTNRELGYSTPVRRVSDGRGAPFVGQTSPGGFIALTGGREYPETIRHELNHLRSNALADLPPDPYRSSPVNPNYRDTTHGPGEHAGAGFFGGDIQKSPYYEWFLKPNPWSGLRRP